MHAPEVFALLKFVTSTYVFSLRMYICTVHCNQDCKTTHPHGKSIQADFLGNGPDQPDQPGVLRLSDAAIVVINIHT